MEDISSRGTLTGLRSRLDDIQQGLVQGLARSCTWAGATSNINIDQKMKRLRAALTLSMIHLKQIYLDGLVTKTMLFL